MHQSDRLQTVADAGPILNDFSRLTSITEINMKKNFKNFEAGSTVSREPRLVGNIVMDMFRGWSHNTEFSVDLKTILRSDPRAVDGKTYQGVLRRDVDCDEYRYDDHFTFVETCPKTPQKHNPQVFCGKYITITQRDDGTYRPNLKPIVIGDGFDIDGFATDVANELLWALEGLVGKSE